jgi:hypothetical protein
VILVYVSTDPIAGSAWNASRDYASQSSWQATIGENLTTTDIFSAGVYFGTSPMSIQGLTASEGMSLQYVKDFCSHNYPQSASTANLSLLMGHSAIASQILPFKAEYSAASSNGKSYIMGETNSGECSTVNVSSKVWLLTWY